MSDTIVVIQENPPQVIVTAEQGPPGPQGATGPQGSDGEITTIVGISSTIAEFNAACSDADFSTGGGTATGTNTGDETTSTIKSKLGISTLSGSNTGDQSSIVGISGTIEQFNTACSDADFATGGGTATGTNTGDNAVNSNYSSLETNATHTGDATGATALTVVGINGQNLAALGTGILKNTTGTGIPSIAVAGDFPTLNQDTTGNAATATSISTPATFTGTTLTDQPTLSDEFLDATGWTSTGWTGDFNNGWSHTTGNTSVLSKTGNAVSATKYQISYTITNRTAGLVTITFGGQSTAYISATGSIFPITTSTSALQIAPTTDFDGTIIISIKSFTAISTPIFTFASSDATPRFGLRVSSSAYNTFMGYQAGGYATTGTLNSSFGSLALKNVTTGFENTAIGYNALALCSNGYRNTAVGSHALELATTAYLNSAFGQNAMKAATTANYNSAFGQNALGAVTTGSANNAFGFDCMKLLTTGSGNCGVGPCLKSITIASNCVAVGNESLTSITTGSSNTAIGNLSGRFIADGSTANQTSTTSCYFGAETKAGANGNTNETVIGYQAIGAGINTVRLGNVSVTKVQFSGNLEFDSATVSTISQIRQTIADTAGVNFTITPGGATVGATDKAGGQLVLTGGQSTGTGESGITLQGYVAGSTGTADCSLQDMVKVLGNKLAFNNATPVTKPTVTGSKVSGAALDSLLAALVSLGLITDSTSA